MQQDPIVHRPVVHLLDPGERIELFVPMGDGELRVTDRRLIVSGGDHVRLNIGYEDLRRIQFDIETMRPAVMVLVPHRASDPPQVLNVPREDLRHAAELLAFVGERLP